MITFPMSGNDVHVVVALQEITRYLDIDRSHLICFRCGEMGHVRFQCLNFRVRLCQKYMSGSCTDKNCCYAHGPENIRTPWKARCVRVIKQEGQLVCIGCNSHNHTFRKCPLHQNVLIL